MALIEDFEPPSSKEKAAQKSNNLFDSIRAFLATKSRSLSLESQKLFLVAGNAQSAVKVFFKSNRFLPHYALVALTAIAMIANVGESSRAYALSVELIEIDPEAESSIVQTLDHYTPTIANDALSVEKANQALAYSDGFVDNSVSIDTQITAREEPLPDNSSETVYYVVRAGDTLTALGWKFGVKLVTLKYLNDVDNIDAIKPGVRLKIPPRGYEVPASQLAKKEAEKKAKLAAANRSTVSRSSTSRQTYNGDYEGGGGVGLIVPLNHNGITRGLSRGHTGVDYRANVGTPIYAAASGVVIQTSTGWSGGYGNEIVLSHGGGVATRYAHLNRIAVSSGQTVSQGQVIGYSGNTGRSTGPHLHFEKMINGRFVNPF